MKSSSKYLVLEITNGIDTVMPKMGGAFEIHIPLIAKVAESLLEKPIIWSTWNPRKNPKKCGNDSWFYKLELNNVIGENL